MTAEDSEVNEKCIFSLLVSYQQTPTQPLLIGQLLIFR